MITMVRVMHVTMSVPVVTMVTTMMDHMVTFAVAVTVMLVTVMLVLVAVTVTVFTFMVSVRDRTYY